MIQNCITHTHTHTLACCCYERDCTCQLCALYERNVADTHTILLKINFHSTHWDAVACQRSVFSPRTHSVTLIYKA
jgi:hypothetical protein